MLKVLTGLVATLDVEVIVLMAGGIETAVLGLRGFLSKTTIT